MLASGALGGLANALTTTLNDEESYPILKRIIVGTIASIAVPAFLNMISSSILKEDMSSLDYFIFAGFCLIAGFSSKSFLTSMSKRLVERLNKIENQQDELKSEVAPILDKETEIEDSEIDNQQDFNIEDQDRKVLLSLSNSNYSRRSLKGIMSETKLSGLEVSNSLRNLKSKNIVNQKIGKEKDLFWLTIEGRKLARLVKRSHSA